MVSLKRQKEIREEQAKIKNIDTIDYYRVEREAELKWSLQRYKDIENGKTIPTFLEFFKLCILFGIAENVNLKEFYPWFYEQLKEEIDEKGADAEPFRALKRKNYN